MSATLRVGALILAMAIVQLAGGLLGIVVPLDLKATGVSNTNIGLIAAIYSAGFMAGAAIAPRLLADISNIRTYSIAAGLGAAAVLVMALQTSPFAWAGMRFIQGFCFALMFASAESWLTEATPQRNRGSVIGIYHVAAKLALALGPFFAIGYAETATEPYIWAGIFFAIGLIPICATRLKSPEALETEPFPISQMLKVTPSAVFGVFIAGVSNTGFLALLPVYAREATSVSASEAAATLFAFAWVGGMISQWPAGLISDLMDRRLIVAVLGIVAGVSTTFLAIMDLPPGSMITAVIIAIWGAGALSFYGICVAHAADRCKPSQITRMMSGLLFVWAAGSVIGPALFGFVMTEFGTRGLFIVEAVFGFSLVLVMVGRVSQKASIPEESREPFGIIQPTSIAAAEIDPRGDTETQTAT